jgi:hypothetical protein
MRRSAIVALIAAGAIGRLWGGLAQSNGGAT